MATEVERSLVLLSQRIAENQVVATPMLQLPPRALPPTASQSPFEPLKRITANLLGN
jgi:hypothetical protein